MGVGIGKGGDVSDAIKKATDDAKKNLVTVTLHKNTIPHDIMVKDGSAKVLLKPAREGRGIVAGGAVRAVVDYAGIKDIVSKSLGTSNKINVARATVKALAMLNAPQTRKMKKEKAVEKKEKTETANVKAQDA